MKSMIMIAGLSVILSASVSGMTMTLEEYLALKKIYKNCEEKGLMSSRLASEYLSKVRSAVYLTGVDDPAHRAFGCLRLGMHPEAVEWIIPRLAPLLADRSEPRIEFRSEGIFTVADYAEEALTNLAESDVEPVFPLLYHQNRHVRQRTLTVLGTIGDRAATKEIIQLLKREPEGSVRAGACFALKGIGDPAAVPSLIAALEDQDVYVIRVAIKALGEIGDPRGLPPLIDCLKNHQLSHIRRVAAYALGETGSKEAVEPLIQALKDPSMEVRKSAAEALGKLRDSRALEPLKELVKYKKFSKWDKLGYAREGILENMKKMDGPQARDILTYFAKHGDKVEREAAEAFLEDLSEATPGCE